eukprot:103476-Karenia_brevis.AAC.1
MHAWSASTIFLAQRQFRAIARGLHCLTKQIFAGWSSSNLSQAATETKSSIQHLKRHPYDLCLVCGAKLEQPTVRTYDARQAFEAIP